MIKFARTSLSVFSVVLLTVASAHATCPSWSPHCIAAPELSPEIGAGALVLIGGAVMAIRGRRKKS
jgi:hypothetical protein